MTLPDLALQIVYARVGWALVFATLLLALWRGPVNLTRPALVAILATMLVLMALPGTLSPAYWLGLAFQYPSGLLVGCCALRLVERWHGIRRSRAMPQSLAGVLVVSGALLYLDTFGLLARGFYYAGFWPLLSPIVAILGALACALAIVRGDARSPAAAMLGAIALFSLLRLPTGNLWDAMLDPLLCGWAVLTLLVGALRKSDRRAANLAAARASDRIGGAAQTPQSQEAALAPALQSAPMEQFSSVKE